MKTRKLTIFRHISILVFALISGLCLLFMFITYLSTKNYHEASTQLLNKDVAKHIAQFTSPFESDGINKQKADSVFYNAMVTNPTTEVYFLDTTGKVIAYHPNENKVLLTLLQLGNIRKLIASEGQEYIKGPDPRDPGNPKIFSAAEVKSKAKNLGFIYVILGSNKNVTNMLYGSCFGSLLIKVFFIIIILSIIFTLIYLRQVQRSFNRMIGVLERFQNGDLQARFNINQDKELAPVTSAFNKMADLLVYNIDRLTKSEKERKDFIANISHDLRTPLSIARGYTETLLMKNEQRVGPNEQEEFLQLVHRKIRQVEHMVKQLFDLSKMEAAELVPKKEPFVFSEILLEIIQASSSEAYAKNINIDCTRCKNPSWIFADVGMMERVVQNLVVNAIRYTPEKGTIIVSLAKKETELIFEIENSGENLNLELLEWLNTSDVTDGGKRRAAQSGIGLMIVRKILHLHEYAITAEAIMGRGNKFTVRMPVLQNEL